MTDQEEPTKHSVRLIGNEVTEPVTLEPEIAEGLTSLMHHCETMLRGGIDPGVTMKDSDKTYGQDAAEKLYRFRMALAGEDGHKFVVTEDGPRVQWDDEDEGE